MAKDQYSGQRHRKKDKERKKKKTLNWEKKDGHIAPIFVPTTPGPVLMKKFAIAVKTISIMR